MNTNLMLVINAISIESLHDLTCSTPPSNNFDDLLSVSQLDLYSDSIQPDTEGIYVCHRCDYTGELIGSSKWQMMA